MPATISGLENDKFEHLVINEISNTLDVYMKNIKLFEDLSKEFDEYEMLSQTDEAAPETFDIHEDINNLQMTFSGHIGDSLKFIKEYYVFTDVTYKKVLEKLNELLTSMSSVITSGQDQNLLEKNEEKSVSEDNKILNDECKENERQTSSIESTNSEKVSLNNSSCIFYHDQDISETLKHASEKILSFK